MKKIRYILIASILIIGAGSLFSAFLPQQAYYWDIFTRTVQMGAITFPIDTDIDPCGINGAYVCTVGIYDAYYEEYGAQQQDGTTLLKRD